MLAGDLIPRLEPTHDDAVGPSGNLSQDVSW